MFKKYFLYIINEIYLLNMSLFFIHYCNVAMLRDNKSVNCYFDRLLPRKYDSITTCPSKRHQKVCGGEVCRWRSWWWGGGGGGGGEWVSEWVSECEWVSESEWEWVRVRGESESERATTATGTTPEGNASTASALWLYTWGRSRYRLASV